MSEILDGEDIVQARIHGESVGSIATRLSCTLAEVHKVLDRFAETVIDDKTRKHSLALELERLDQLRQVFGARALEGGVQCGALVAKIIERRCTMLGLYTPPTATLRVIEAEAPRQRSTEQIEAASIALAANGCRGRSTTILGRRSRSRWGMGPE
jgi:hypothetical protein